LSKKETTVLGMIVSHEERVIVRGHADSVLMSVSDYLRENTGLSKHVRKVRNKKGV